MVIALDSRSSGPGSSSGWGHCVVFLGKTLNSHSASLHPENGQMGTRDFNAGGSSIDPSRYMSPYSFRSFHFNH